MVVAVTYCHAIHIQGEYPPLATDSEGNDSFLLYQTSSIKCPQKLTEEGRRKCAVVQEMSHDYQFINWRKEYMSGVLGEITN